MGQQAWLLSLDVAFFAERAARWSAPPSLILNGLSQQDSLEASSPTVSVASTVIQDGLIRFLHENVRINMESIC